MAAAWPVPLRGTDCGEPVALSVMETVPVRLPVAVGLKVTLTVQEAATARLAGHGLFETAKSPEAVMEESVTAWLPELAMVNVCALLVVPTVCAGKVREVGLRVSV